MACRREEVFKERNRRRDRLEVKHDKKREVVGMYMYVSLLLVTYNFIGLCFRLMSTGSKESDGHGMKR